jgi:chromosome segregation and condensation protein ScpB
VKGEGANKTRQTLTAAVAEYLSDTKDTKSKKTAQAYTLALTAFQESCSKICLDQIGHRDLKPTYIAHLKRRGLSDRTVYNRYLNVIVFLNSAG